MSLLPAGGLGFAFTHPWARGSHCWHLGVWPQCDTQPALGVLSLGAWLHGEPGDHLVPCKSGTESEGAGSGDILLAKAGKWD